MAITSAQLQAEFGTNAMTEQVLMELAPYGAASQYWLIRGGVDYPGRCKMIATTASDNAATQAAACRTALGNGVA